MILKQVIKYPNANALEATWVDIDGNVVKCHSYSDAQMAELRADLGADASYYEVMIAEVEANIAPITPKTQAQLDAEASQARDDAMLQGFIYGTNVDGTDRYISVTKDDGDGMVQVKASFELGLTSTVIHFSNGSKLPMSAEEFPAFALQFVTERGKFFS